MSKFGYIATFLFFVSGLQANVDNERPQAEPNQKLSKVKSFIRSFDDFMGTENLGFQSLIKANEDYIKAIIHELQMDDYCIEIRGMSHHAQRLFGRLNAFVIPSMIFSKKSHAYLFVSEEWFQTLRDQEKQALIRHELMHIKQNHGLRGIRFVVGTWVALCLLETLIIKTFIKTEQPQLQSFDIKNLFQVNNFASVPRWIVWSLLTSKYSRSLEKEADIEAAKTMIADKQGFVDLFQEFKDNSEDPDSKFAFKRVMHKLLKPIGQLFASHPTLDERIAYIQDIK